MRFLVLYSPETGEEGAAPDPEHMAAMRKLVETMTKAGALLSTEPLSARANGARVQLSDGTFVVTEEDRRASGYAFLQAGSKSEAIELCKQFLKVAGDGETEIRQVMEMPPRSA